jgi:predicted peptidase
MEDFLMTTFTILKWPALSVALCLAAVTATAAETKSPADLFQAAVFKSDTKGSLPYRLLKPAGYDAKREYPLVVFLHGAGERGDNNGAQLVHVVSIFITPENREKYPCFVLAPQCPAGQQWVNVPWDNQPHAMPKEPAQPMVLLVKLIAQLEKDYRIDSRRLYVMGLSMGGYGTWDALVRYPQMFAAGVPMCGSGDEKMAPTIAHIPVWVFQGAKDPVVRVGLAQGMVAALRKAGGSPKYTEYPQEGHICWVPASKEPELLPWLFAQKR